MKEVQLDRVCPKCIAAGKPRDQAYGRRERSTWWTQAAVDDLVIAAIRRAAATEGVPVATLTVREKARIGLAAMERTGVPLVEDANGRPSAIVWTQAAEDAAGTQLDATWTNDLAEHYARDHANDPREIAQREAAAAIVLGQDRSG